MKVTQEVDAFTRHPDQSRPAHRWRLQILAQNLSILLQSDRMVAYPWEGNQRPTYQVQVEVLRFEPNAEQLVELWARWSILARERPLA